VTAVWLLSAVTPAAASSAGASVLADGAVTVPADRPRSSVRRRSTSLMSSPSRSFHPLIRAVSGCFSAGVTFAEFMRAPTLGESCHDVAKQPAGCRPKTESPERGSLVSRSAPSQASTAFFVFS